MRKFSAKKVALGGVLAALSVVIMCLGGLIPVATFICPMLCMLCQLVVVRMCGSRIAWAWYVGVTMLCLLLAPDKEAASIFLILGYYPILKPAIDRSRLRLVWKALLFNGAIAFLYSILLFLFGLKSLIEEYRQLGNLGLIIMLILGNVTFFLFDGILTRLSRKRGSRT